MGRVGSFGHPWLTVRTMTNGTETGCPMMRVLTGSMIQESNTFSPLSSDLGFFRAGCLLFDVDSIEQMVGKRTELSGFIAVSRRWNVELVPTLAAWAASGGPFAR